MSSAPNEIPALTDDEFDAWCDAKIEATLGAAVAEFGKDHPDYAALLGIVGNVLVHESDRVSGRWG